MELSLDPDMQRFVEEKVRAGDYKSPQEVVREALTRMRAEELARDSQPDEETWAAIDRARAEFDAGSDQLLKRLPRNCGPSTSNNQCLVPTTL